uniref:Uncharacterized protein n=1 Tax=Medicago truncatula TaxID=3880 RepID=A2Q2I8_MEDTR|nr:hypothetical protein MtrDRAFT_AC150889g36v2 [Medicago truncatula]
MIRNAGVRKTSIRALKNLYEVDDDVPTLATTKSITIQFQTHLPWLIYPQPSHSWIE